jgi:hypothetical protein
MITDQRRFDLLSCFRVYTWVYMECALTCLRFVQQIDRKTRRTAYGRRVNSIKLPLLWRNLRNGTTLRFWNVNLPPQG